LLVAGNEYLAASAQHRVSERDPNAVLRTRRKILITDNQQPLRIFSRRFVEIRVPLNLSGEQAQ